MRASHVNGGRPVGAQDPAFRAGPQTERTVTIRKRFTQGPASTMHNNQRVVPPDEERVDALLQHIASLDVPSVRYMAGQFVPDFDATVPVADGIEARVIDRREADGELTSLTICLSSGRRSVSGIRAFLDDCFHHYRALINNRIGDKLFVFEHTSIMDQCAPRQARFKGEAAVHPPRIRYTKHPFESARSLENVYFGDMPRLRSRLRHFKENRAWYEERGIPWTFGLLMHGIPGAGKTSTIKAIANYMGRHIVNVKLGEVKTKTQLHGLFFDEQMRVASEDAGMPGNDQTYTIPIARRLFVLEDIDCMNSPIVLSREIRAAREKEAGIDKEEAGRVTERVRRPHDFEAGGALPSRLQPYGSAPPPPWAGGRQEEELEMQDEPLADTGDELDLSSLLNCLDGTLEVPGRMVVMTSNHPEMLDPALTRKGRVDMHIELGKATGAIVKQMYAAWYKEPWPKDRPDPADLEMTPADVGSVLFDHLDRPEEAVRELAGQAPTPVNLTVVKEKKGRAGAGINIAV